MCHFRPCWLAIGWDHPQDTIKVEELSRRVLFRGMNSLLVSPPASSANTNKGGANKLEVCVWTIFCKAN